MKWVRNEGKGAWEENAPLFSSGGIRPKDALNPYTPHSAAGMRIEPPPSLPSGIGTSPAATAAAAPPLEPPDTLSRFHGLRVAPKTKLSVVPL